MTFTHSKGLKSKVCFSKPLLPFLSSNVSNFQMKSEMEVNEIEAVLEKIWDLHDKLSDAIHSISRAHFLNSVKNPTGKSGDFYVHRKKKFADDESGQRSGLGFVFVKEFRVDDEEPAVQEAKSLYDIRTALENLEDQLDFFHTVQTQQRAERDAAIARLEQSRIYLAMKLGEHHGKNFKVIEEAQVLVSDVQDASRFVSPDHLYGSTQNPSNQNFKQQKGKRQNVLVNFFLSGYALVSKSLNLDNPVGILGNAALIALSTLALMHLNQASYYKEKNTLDLAPPAFTKHVMKVSSSSDHVNQMDVTLARG